MVKATISYEHGLYLVRDWFGCVLARYKTLADATTYAYLCYEAGCGR